LGPPCDAPEKAKLQAAAAAPFPTMAAMPIEGDWARDGYLIVRGMFTPERAAQLLRVAEQCMRQWKLCNPETGRPGTADPDAARSMRREPAQPRTRTRSLFSVWGVRGWGCHTCPTGTLVGRG
jgi:hypothetical protein